MVEPEYRPSGRSDDKVELKQAFMAAIANNRNYSLYKRFSEPFRLLGIRFSPDFPTEDWNFPSPEILIYRRAG